MSLTSTSIIHTCSSFIAYWSAKDSSCFPPYFFIHIKLHIFVLTCTKAFLCQEKKQSMAYTLYLLSRIVLTTSSLISLCEALFSWLTSPVIYRKYRSFSVERNTCLCVHQRKYSPNIYFLFVISKNKQKEDFLHCSRISFLTFYTICSPKDDEFANYLSNR